MAVICHKPLTVDEIVERVEQAIRDAWKRGLTDVSMTLKRSAVDASEPGDMMHRYEPGPTLEIELTLHNSKETRQEIWL